MEIRSHSVTLFAFLLPSLLLCCNLCHGDSKAARVRATPRTLANQYRHVTAESRTSTAEHDMVRYETRYFMQRLDHFNDAPQSCATFRQKYLVNDTYWGGKTAPIFVYTGNEGIIELFTNNTGFMWDIAPKFNAMLVFIEHRYYGESMPFGSNDAAYSNSSTLGYLTTTQAIADYVTLILDLKANLSAPSAPVLVFGGSYGGMLAAWMRMKYPHIVMGAVASSAPILNFYGLASPYAFYDIISNDFKSESEHCYSVLKNSWQELQDALSSDAGQAKLNRTFNMCGDNIGEIPFILEDALVYVAMQDYPTPSNFLTSLPAYPIKEICRAIDDPTLGNDTFAMLKGALTVYYNNTGDANCFGPSSSDPYGMGAGWNWQACTEMMLTSQGSSNSSIFPADPFSFGDFVASCQSYTGGLPPRPYWIETEFGGFDIKNVLKRSASNIIFFNGLRDPWSGGGVLKSISKRIIALVEPQGAHHVDLRFATKEDPDWLKEVRRKERRIISHWLRQFYKDHGIAY